MKSAQQLALLSQSGISRSVSGTLSKKATLFMVIVYSSITRAVHNVAATITTQPDNNKINCQENILFS